MIQARNTVKKLEKLSEGRGRNIIAKILRRFEEAEKIDRTLIGTGTPRNPEFKFRAGLEWDNRRPGGLLPIPESGTSWQYLEQVLWDILLDVSIKVRHLLFALLRDPNLTL